MNRSTSVLHPAPSELAFIAISHTTPPHAASFTVTGTSRSAGAPLHQNRPSPRSCHSRPPPLQRPIAAPMSLPKANPAMVSGGSGLGGGSPAACKPPPAIEA
ncbi:hypothetical protein BE08_21330 [Sorangium cellulosum]|uniref:Uncharacterized protein n=1 Tax=Sorangium cellulosum TaxID=56 RepID=A0A150P8N9_SORCE|nr:hypothetical protein BE08_21330 [Sorangium cellulosum]